jgi:hypothetical protein
MKMSSQFKDRLVQDYKTNKQWSVLYEILIVISLTQATRREIISIDKNTTKISKLTHDDIEFERREDLVYHLNRFTFKARLCVSSSLLQNIFKMTHDDLAHADFHRVFVIISKTLYIRRLAHHLRQYIEYCSQCLLNQTKRHKSYESFVFISSVKTSFHTIVMNFVFALSQSDKEKFDILLTMINKFFKTKLLISRLNIWKAHNWAISLWKYLQLCNWKLSREIISDKNAKFRFDLWKFLFKVVETDLLISIVYHSQIDDQSERTNQTIEIALRYLLTSNSNLFWHETLSTLQQTFMNTMTFTKHISNQILYETNTRWQMTLLNEEFIEYQQLFREIARKNVVDVIDFANARFKVIYDVKHQSFVFNIEDKAYLRLHHEYFLLEKDNSKLSNQRSDSYIILRKINNMTFQLNLSAISRIHSIVFIAQLKSTSDSDSYDKSRSTISKSMNMTNDDISQKRSFEVKRILKKRTRKYEKITTTQYLMKWLEWRLEHNSWISKKDMKNSMKLIMKYNNRLTAIFSDTT